MNKTDIMKAAELSYNERVELAARAIYNLEMNEPITQQEWDWGVGENYRNDAINQAKAALKAAGIDQLLQATELLKQVEWQPIESAPKNKDILVCQGQNGIIRTAHGVNEYGNWITGSHGAMDYIVGVTHWQPLPQPPVIIEKEGV